MSDSARLSEMAASGGAASDFAGFTSTATPTITSAIADGPVLKFINKRLRSLRKKYKRIVQMEEYVSKGKILTKEQQEVLRSKTSVSHCIEELEKLRAPLATLVAEEISLAIKNNQSEQKELEKTSGYVILENVNGKEDVGGGVEDLVFYTRPPANKRPDDMAAVAAGVNVGSADAPCPVPLNGSVVSVLHMDGSVGQHQKTIEDFSGSSVMRWVESQHVKIIKGVHIAIRQESWDPISPQEQHGSSIVEVYRMVVEIVDQVFAFRVPVDFEWLSTLFSGIDFALQGYAECVVENLNIKDLVPALPALTQYKKESWIKAFMKKFLDQGQGVPEERKSDAISVLPTRILCVQLNTLHYAVKLLNELDNSISARWSMKIASENFLKRSLDEKARSFIQKNKFDKSRKEFGAAIDRICEYIGFKIVFGDLREPFIENLYIPNVSQSRLDAVIKPLESAFKELCDAIIEPLRDRIVTSLLQAFLKGLSRVLLEGGPSRIFSPADAKYMEDDLDVLKELFIFKRGGLPREVVENHVTNVKEIIRLHSYESRELVEDFIRINVSFGGTKLGAGAYELLRILYHRSDTKASEFVMQYRMFPYTSLWKKHFVG